MKKKISKKEGIEKNKIIKLKRLANKVRIKILKMAVKLGVGHIAPSFSCTEILIACYFGGILSLNLKDFKKNKKDYFIMSKGHASMALYVVLAEKGFISKKSLSNFSKKGSKLGVHAENVIAGVETFTGSLGHGLSLGAGLALAAKLDKKEYLSLVLMGDGECYEGSVWEAAMFASDYRLDNLITIIDHNGFSATAPLKNSLEVNSLKKKWKSMGWDTVIVDGHSFEELLSVLKNISLRRSAKPLAIIALTTKGKGVSFMENNPIWHYRAPKGEELKIACCELKIKNKGYDEKLG
ncbi:MAG: transketolase [Candidatus Omnitrophica bacterium]|nr:transketolase [Candidatus Omnitrophota bacterium]